LFEEVDAWFALQACARQAAYSGAGQDVNGLFIG
jgi:hypothetical protein